MGFSLLPSIKRGAAALAAAREPLPADPEKLAARLAEFRGHLVDCLGVLPEGGVPLNPRVESEALLEEGVIQERVVYQVEEDVAVPAHVYRPTGAVGRLPGILLLQGWDPDKYSLPLAKVALARAGYVVLFPDNRCSGERADVGGQVNVIPAAGALGMTFLGMNTFDNMRALDYLASREDVHPERLACVGHCWGGGQALTLAALDERVRVVCPVCAVSTYEALLTEYIFQGGHTCLGTFVPGLLRYGDMQDLMALIAPRPVLVQNNVNDGWFPVSGYLKVKAELETVYAALGQPEQFEAHLSSTVHDLTPEFTARIIVWLQRFLSPRV
jgi:dienelactone hydrolase